jgi:hypothetical protein
MKTYGIDMTKDEAPASPKDAALKLALEALEANQPVNYCMNSNGERFPMMHEDPFRFDRNTKAITAIEEALAQPTKALLLSDQQLRDMCAKFGWDDSYQSIKAYRTVEDMSLELNQLEK